MFSSIQIRRFLQTSANRLQSSTKQPEGVSLFKRGRRFPASLSTEQQSLSAAGTSLDKFQIISSPDPNHTSGSQIQKIHDRGFVANRVWFQGGLILGMDGGCWLWDVADWHQLKSESVKPWQWLEILYPRPEILLVGTGSEMHPLPAPVLQFFQRLGVQAEVMNSKRAASTYNILVEEGRSVAAAMLPLNSVRARSPLEIPKPLEIE